MLNVVMLSVVMLNEGIRQKPTMQTNVILNLIFFSKSNLRHHCKAQFGLKITGKYERRATKLVFFDQVSISPTFYEQLLRQNPFAKKLETQIVST